MALIESPELRTVDAHSQELIVALSTDPVCVAGALVGKKFIQDGVLLEMITGGDTPTRKATILVEAVRKEIQADPERFTQFLEILSEQACAKETVKSLQSTCESEFNECMSSVPPGGELASPFTREEGSGVMPITSDTLKCREFLAQLGVTYMYMNA